MTKTNQKSLYVVLDQAEHGVLRLEAALTGKTLSDIVRAGLVDPLRRKHRGLIRRAEQAKVV